MISSFCDCWPIFLETGAPNSVTNMKVFLDISNLQRHSLHVSILIV